MYHQIDEIVAEVIASSTLTLMPGNLAPGDRERLALLAEQMGVSKEDALAASRQRLRAYIAARQEAHQIALAASEESDPSVC